MLSILDKLYQLTKQLFPTGRAFRIADNSVKEKVTKALLYSEERFYNDSVGILDSILPDNNNFTAEDATRWEQRLGMIVNENVPLQDRKDAIIRKMNHPGTILARQSAGYLQDQLQLAGFNVYVYENIPEQTIENAIGVYLDINQLGDESELGNFDLGDIYLYYPDLFSISELGGFDLGYLELDGFQYNNLVANNIEYVKDIGFNLGDNYKRTFFVGGVDFPTFADVSIERQEEFRQLILKIKPAETVAVLLINYI